MGKGGEGKEREGKERGGMEGKKRGRKLETPPPSIPAYAPIVGLKPVKNY